MSESNLPEHKAQEERILRLLRDENPCKWVPVYGVTAPDDGPRILQYCRAICNLRKGRFDGKRHNIENRTERRNGETHGFYRWMPGEYCKGEPVRSTRSERVEWFEQEFGIKTTKQKAVPVTGKDALPLFAGVQS